MLTSRGLEALGGYYLWAFGEVQANVLRVHPDAERSSRTIKQCESRPEQEIHSSTFISVSMYIIP
jgi:ribosomal protein S1